MIEPVAPATIPTPTLQWVGDASGFLRLIDQTRLPTELVTLDCRTAEDVWHAIRKLAVRGAPAIGIAAAYGLILGLGGAASADEADYFARLDQTIDYLASSRPTAVNLCWSLARMRRRALVLRGVVGVPAIHQALLAEAQAIHGEDRALCHAIGRHGAALIDDGASVLTHCNAGALATSEHGTALGIIYEAQRQGKRVHVWIDETRPLLQGARLTAWELQQYGVAATLICDAVAAQVMRQGRVQAVVTGADRIAANGDVANKIGTYGLALLAAAHKIPFYVAAPTSTFDLSLPSGDQIPIEQRAAEEVTEGFGRRTAPPGIDVYNPAFDVTQAQLVTAIVCECGVIRPVNRQQIAATVSPEAHLAATQ